MSLKAILNISRVSRVQSINSRRYFASGSKEVLPADETPIFLEEEDPHSNYYQELEKKRNKSRLSTEHRNILFGVKPYKEPMTWYHDKIKYKRRMLGRFGMGAVDMQAGIAWPTPKELEAAKEYERVAYPVPLRERWERLANERKEREEKKLAREMDIASKMEQMDKWIAEVKAKVQKKEDDLMKAKAHKERLIEEVRQHFGFKVSVHDERFKEMLAKKEKEDKKRLKEAKKAARTEKLRQKVEELYKAQGIPVDGNPIVAPEAKKETDE